MRQYSGSSGSWWLITLVLLAFHLNEARAETISKINYGVLFEGKGSVSAVYDYWPHTFQVPFPDLKQQELSKSTTNFFCAALAPKHVQACLVMRRALDAVDDMRSRYMSNLRMSVKLAKRVMSRGAWNDTSRSRSKRAILPIFGDISRALFGTATEKQVKQIAKHIDLLEQRNERMTKAFAQYTDDLSSFMTLSNRRHMMIRNTIHDNRQAISAIAKDFEAMTSSMHHNLQFSVLLGKEIYLAMSMQEALQEFLHGIHALLQHSISPYILPFHDIKLTVNHINSRLAQASSQLMVQELLPRDFYSSDNFLWTFKNQSLFITVKFPLVSAVSHLDLYKVYTVPVPFNESSSHTTQLLDLPQYIAFTRDRHYYTFPAPNIWEKGTIDAHEHNLPLFPVHSESCTTAIFFDNRKAVLANCDFRVQVNAIKPNIIHISQGQYLVANVTNIFLRCPSGLRQQDGCKFCIITIPCLCDLSSGSVYFPPRVNHCMKDKDTTTTVHPVNLAVLMHVYHDHQISDIYGDTTYVLPAVNTPAMNLFKHNFSDFIAADKQQDLSLQRIADAIRNDKQIFQTLSDPILDKLEFEDDPSVFSWNSLATIIDTICIAALIILVIGLGFKVHTLTKVVATLQMANSVKPEPILYLFPTSTTTTANPIVIVKERDDTLLYIILVFSVFTLAITFYKYFTRASRHSFIGLELTNGKSCSVISLQKLPFCPKFFHVTTNHNFDNFKVTGLTAPKFSWSKNSLFIMNLLDQSELSIPEQVPLSVFQAFKVKRILKSEQIFAYLVGIHGMHAFHMKVCPLACDMCRIDLPAVEQPAQVTEPEQEVWMWVVWTLLVTVPIS